MCSMKFAANIASNCRPPKSGSTAAICRVHTVVVVEHAAAIHREGMHRHIGPLRRRPSSIDLHRTVASPDIEAPRLPPALS
jgi:hypothetical protein